MACHAGIQFAVEHPEAAQSWEKASNSLVVLGVPDEETVLDDFTDARADGIRGSLFFEPDIDEYVACAFVLTDQEAKRFRNLALILRDPTDLRWVRESDLRHSLHSKWEGGE
jgi:hypothetical protein